MEEEKYIRVGTVLYKISRRPLQDGGYVQTMLRWKYETFRDDYKNKIKPSIVKYDDFCVFPNHENYEREIGKHPHLYYNQYEELTHIPKQDSFVTIDKFIRHIFEEQYDLGMDYLQLLYQKPMQKLPILLLVSPEGNTGKTTFMNLVKLIFQNNVIFNTNEDFRSNFNAEWADKLVVFVDEALLNRREDSERIKNLSTTIYYKVEAKGKDRYEAEFFAKFILAANNDLDAINISPLESRYWVRRVNVIKNEDRDPKILEKMEKEVPAFLHHLSNRTLVTQKESRMWFNPALLKTEALRKIMAYNQGTVEVDILKLISEVFTLSSKSELFFTTSDMQSLLWSADIEVSKSQLRTIFQTKFRINVQKQQRYVYFSINEIGELVEDKKNGRPYMIKKEQVDTLLLQ